jgi:hypothetical protein
MSLLLSPMAKNSSAGFYNGVVTTSLRFDKGSSSRLTFTPDSDGGDTWTWSGWYKVSNGTGSSTVADVLFMTGDGAGIQHRNTRALGLDDDGDTSNLTTELFRDSSSWYHILANSNGTTSKLFVNGTEVTLSGSPNIGDINNSTEHYIGSADTNYYTDGYLADINFVSGTALTPSSFTETKNGVLIPIKPNVTYGGNGWRLQFLQTGTNADANGIGADTSGNNNHWAVDNLNAHDVVPDSPENNFCTWNSLSKGVGTTTTEGNLKAIYTSNNQAGISSTFSVDTGKYYFEVGCQTASVFIGVAPSTYKNPDNINSTTGSIHYADDGNKSLAGTETSYGASYGDGDVIGVALNLDDGEVTFYKNNSSQGALSLTSGLSYGISSASGSSTSTFTVILNSGQDSSFAGTETAQGNTDANGIGDFYYAPPSGFLALCTANLPEPTIGANSTTQADDHFESVLYEGDGSTQNIAVNFKPDWTWIKNRDATDDHQLFDSSRGATNVLESNTTAAEAANDDTLTAFISTGFSLGDDVTVNTNNESYASWNWLANGGTTSSNSDGSITSTVQANTDAGFSIVTYTGTGSNATVGHGLSSVPQMYIVKRRSNTGNWYTYHESIGNTKRLRLDENSVATTESTAWNNTSPTSSVFSIGTSVDVNAGSNTYVSYCFHSVEGYSKIGSYTGNVALDGTFVYTGFEPAFILLTNTVNAGYNWSVWDGVRNPFNVATKHLFPDLAYVEGAFPSLDLLSNGFKLRHPDLYYNAGVKFIYMAFAKSSFKYANAR